VGVPAGLNLLGLPIGEWFGGNPFHHFIAQTLLEEPHALEFKGEPMVISIVIALAGLTTGWLVYVWKPLAAGQTDPLKKVLGPIYTMLENKYWVDEAYDFVFVKPSLWVAENVIYKLFDKTLIDGTLHGIARLFEWIGFRAKDADTYVINGGADRFSELFMELGDWGKAVQSGRVQQYLAVGIAGILMLAAVFAWALLR
jgi:NADH-quinone oxidoreductase subunit L